MGLGPTLIGAIVGAAVGVGLHQFLEVGLQMEASWFFIVIGLLTGLGVRQANKSLVGRVSYFRGAISGLVALAAIVGSIYLVSLLMAKKDTVKSGKPLAAETAEDAGQDADGEAADADALPPAPEAAERATTGAAVGRVGARPDDFNTWQFVFMAVGTFIAYELGRGSGPSAHGAPEAGDQPQPRGTDPSD
jgi:hypothetical protein